MNLISLSKSFRGNPTTMCRKGGPVLAAGEHQRCWLNQKDCQILVGELFTTKGFDRLLLYGREEKTSVPAERKSEGTKNGGIPYELLQKWLL